MGMNEIMKCALFTPLPRGWGIPLLFWGKPGVGKSDIIESIGREFGFPTEVLSPGERGEGAFGVTPIPFEEKIDGKIHRVITYPKPDWVLQFEDEEGAAEGEEPGGLLFLDEINTVPALQPALLGLIQARRIGSSYLGRRVRVIAAANPPAVSAGGYDLAPPAANRMGHIAWREPSAEDWGDWLIQHDGLSSDAPAPKSAIQEEKRVLKAWPREFAKAKGVVRAFTRAKPSLLHNQPPVGDPQGSRAWPSHRTWAMATAALASSAIHGLDSNDRVTLISSLIGEGATLEFEAFLANADLPDPVDVLDGKVEFKHVRTRLDRTMAVASSCTAFVVSTYDADHQKDLYKKRVENLFELMLTISKDAADVVIPNLKPMSQRRITNLSDKAIKLYARIRPVLDAAGLST